MRRDPNNTSIIKSYMSNTGDKIRRGEIETLGFETANLGLACVWLSKSLASGCLSNGAKALTLPEPIR
jgi:hypothetical protein